MNFQKRKQKISQQLDRQGEVDVKELAAETGISEITIRRDLNRLAAEGMLYRTHGGAVKEEPRMDAHTFEHKTAQNAAVKDAICKVAATQIQDGDIIFMDCGSTVFRLCQFIKNKKIKVVTNSLPVVYALQNSKVSINVIGGELDAGRQAVHGSMANEHIRKYRAGKAFLGVDGISSNGLFANSEKEADITLAFAANAAATYLLCDDSKIGKETYLKFAEANLANFLVTNARADKAVQIRDMGVAVIHTR